MRCNDCHKETKCGYLSETNFYCEECGNKYLIYNDQLNAYVYNEDNHLFYLDDELSDLEIFKIVKEKRRKEIGKKLD